MPTPPHIPAVAVRTTTLASVRLYQSPKPLRTEPRNAAAPADAEDTAILRWGGTRDFGNLESDGFEITTNQLTETSRKTKTKRVHNPEDESQYVDVEALENIQFKDQDNRKWNYKFAGDAGGGGNIG